MFAAESDKKLDKKVSTISLGLRLGQTHTHNISQRMNGKQQKAQCHHYDSHIADGQSKAIWGPSPNKPDSLILFLVTLSLVLFVCLRVCRPNIQIPSHWAAAAVHCELELISHGQCVLASACRWHLLINAFLVLILEWQKKCWSALEPELLNWWNFGIFSKLGRWPRGSSCIFTRQATALVSKHFKVARWQSGDSGRMQSQNQVIVWWPQVGAAGRQPPDSLEISIQLLHLSTVPLCFWRKNANHWINDGFVALGN